MTAEFKTLFLLIPNVLTLILTRQNPHDLLSNTIPIELAFNLQNINYFDNRISSEIRTINSGQGTQS